MKTSTTAVRAALVTLGLISAAPVLAQSTQRAPASDATYWPYQKDFWGYFGATVGRNEYDYSCAGCDEKTTGFRVFGGGTFKGIFGGEVAYVDLGKGDLTGGGSFEARGVNLSLLLNAPIGENSGVFAKVGTIYSWTETNGAVPGFAGGKDDGFGFSYGAGAKIGLSRSVALRVDWDRYRLQIPGGDRDSDLLSAGLQFRF